MKKIVALAMFVAVFSTSCQKTKTQSPTNLATTSSSSQAGINARSVGPPPPIPSRWHIHVRFKHTDEPSSSNPSPASCEADGGICVSFGAIAYPSGQVITQDERNLGIGTMTLKIIDANNMTITPDMTYADKTGNLIMTDDLQIDARVAQKLGYNSITILKGTYKVDSSVGTFGSSNVKIQAK